MSRCGGFRRGFAIPRAAVLIIILISGSLASADTLLVPGEVGLFLDSEGSDDWRIPDLYHPIGFVLARLGPLGLTRVQFSLGVYGEVGLGDAVYFYGEGVEDLDPDPDRFDLRLTDLEVNDEGVVELLAFFVTDWSLPPAEILPRRESDSVALTTSAAPGAVPRPMNWRVPPWMPRHDYFAQGPPILINHGGSAVISIDSDGDRGDTVTVDFDFPYYSYWSGSPEPYELAYGPQWPREDRSGLCPSCTSCPQCQPLNWIETRIEWDPLHANFVSIETGEDANGGMLQVQNSGPGFVEARLDYPGALRHFDRVFALDLEFTKGALPGYLITRTVSSATDPHLTGSLGLRHGGRLLPGCEFFDVVDDDVIDDEDVQAAIDMVSGAIAIDDDRVCRADVNRDGHLNAGDAVLIARRAIGLPNGPPTTGPATYALNREGLNSLSLELQGVAGADFVLAANLSAGTPITLSGWLPAASAAVDDEGRIRLSLSQVEPLPATITVSADGLVPAEVQILSKKAFDGSGAEINFGDAVAVPPTPRALSLETVPNPFNPRTQLRLYLPASGELTVRVYDAAGRVVRRLVDSRPHSAGAVVIDWDGRDDRGLESSSGVYFVRAEIAGEATSTKVSLLK